MTTNYDTLGYVEITWNDNDRDASWYAWRVYRRQAGVALLIGETLVDQASYEFRDYLADSGATVEYTVVQVADRFGTYVESAYVWSDPVVPTSTDYWLVVSNDGADWQSNTRLHLVRADAFDDEYEESTHKLAGRGRQKEYGTYFGKSGEISCQLFDGATTARAQRLALEALKARQIDVYLRTPFGDIWLIATGSLRFERDAGVGTREHGGLSFTYEEVAV